MDTEKIKDFLDSEYGKVISSLRDDRIWAAAKMDEVILQQAGTNMERTLQLQKNQQIDVVEQVSKRKVSALKDLIFELMRNNGAVASQDSFKKVLDALNELVDRYQSDERTSIDRITDQYSQRAVEEGDKLKAKSEEVFRKRKEGLTRMVDKGLKAFDQFEDYYETASFDSPIWSKLEYKSSFPALNYVRLGSVEQRLDLFGNPDSFQFKTPEIVPFFLRQSLTIVYKKEQRDKLKGVVDQLFVRSLMSAEAGNILFYFIDAVGNGSMFLDYLHFDDSTKDVYNKQIFNTLTEVDRLLTSLQLICTDIDQNVRKNRSLEEYNQTEKVPVPYRIVIMDSFPRGISAGSLATIARLVEFEREAGVHFVFLVEKDDVSKMGPILPLTEKYELNEHLVPDERLEAVKNNVIQMTNRSFNASKSVKFHEYYDENVVWWKGNCANFTETPLGMVKASNYDLSFDEEAKKGLPTAHTVIAGQTGCGKSSLIHSFIMGTALKYSPEQVRFFLVDLKGVEFKCYEEFKLPHAEFIAMNGNPEYGSHVLKLVLRKMEARTAYFQSKMVTTLPEFREKYPDEVMPRYFIIIDEYQELFRDLDIARESKESIDRLVSVGRALGFNLILSSQTLPLPASTLTNFSHRIAMRCQVSLGRQVLELPEAKTAHLKVGQAIINSGKQVDTVQSYYLPKEYRTAYLKEVRKKWLDYKGGNYEDDMIVFDGERPALLKNNRVWRKMRKISQLTDIPFSPGEKIMVDGRDVMDTLVRSRNGNILSIGGNLAVSIRALNGCIQSFIPQLLPNEARFDVFNFVNRGKKELFDAIKSSSEEVCRRFADSCYTESSQDLAPVIDEILGEIKDRKERIDSGEFIPSRFLVIYQTANDPDLHEVEKFDEYYQTMKVSPSDLSTKLTTVLSTGPEAGIHCLLHFSDPDMFFSVFSDKEIKLFNHILALQMSEDDSRLFLGGSRPYAGRLYDRSVGEEAAHNRAIYFNAYTMEFEKIKPYSFEL